MIAQQMRRLYPLFALLLILAVTLTGCVGGDDDDRGALPGILTDGGEAAGEEGEEGDRPAAGAEEDDDDGEGDDGEGDDEDDEDD